MRPISFSVEGKIALITGASRGIGEAIATALSDNGAHCILASRKADGLREAADKIVSRGGKADVIPCHMGDLAQIDRMLGEIKDRYGRLDILINNAATNPHSGEMSTVTEAVWDKTFDVNLKGPFFLTQRAAELMSGSGGGAIVNTASIDGIKPGVLRGIYSISKAAVICMTKAYAKELAARNIRVNAVLPGLVDTYMAKPLIENETNYLDVMRTVPAGRHGVPRELAGAVLFLASEAASYTTGAILVVDGGALA